MPIAGLIAGRIARKVGGRILKKGISVLRGKGRRGGKKKKKTASQILKEIRRLKAKKRLDRLRMSM